MFDKPDIKRQAETAVKIYFAGGDYLGYLKAVNSEAVKERAMKLICFGDGEK